MLLAAFVGFKIFKAVKNIEKQPPPSVMPATQLMSGRISSVYDRCRRAMGAAAAPMPPQRMRPRTQTERAQYIKPYVTGYASIVLVACAMCMAMPATALEQDAAVLKPLESLAKSIISSATTGQPLQIDFGASDVVRSFASFTWRTGFPVTMPRDFTQNAQNFYNRVTARVAETEVKDLKRKRLPELKVDLDDIVDALVEQVRQSPDGLYTDYLETQVNGVPLEEACFQVGLQLKAYGVDLVNYRNIAGAVLGVPLMPTVARTVVSAGKLVPTPQRIGNLTSNIMHTPVREMPNAAFNAVSQVSSSALGTAQNMLSAPAKLLRPSRLSFGGGGGSSSAVVAATAPIDGDDDDEQQMMAMMAAQQPLPMEETVYG